MLDYETPIKAKIRKFDLSGHAEREELLGFAEKLAPKQIILTHGDPEARAWFQETFKTVLPETTVVDPAPNEPVITD